MQNQNTDNPETLLADLRTLVSKAEAMIGAAGNTDQEGAIGAMRERLESARERLGEFYTTAKERVTEGAKCTDSAIRANPYTTLAISLGAGFLIGILVGRRSK